MKDDIELLYGDCRIQMWLILRTKYQDISACVAPILTILFKVCLSQVPTFYESSVLKCCNTSSMNLVKLFAVGDLPSSPSLF